jgi:hypothetical protein
MTDTTTSTGPEAARGASTRWMLAGAGLVVVLLLVGLGIWGRGTGPGAPPIEDAGPPPAEAPPALAETTGEEGTLTIQVVSLDRVGAGMVELRLAVTHVGSAATALDIAQRFSADGPDRGTLAEVYLADLGHQRKLFILRDGDGAPIGSRDEQPLAPGERRVLWARYPAPGEADEAVVVHVPHADPMPNVPIGAAATEDPRPGA